MDGDAIERAGYDLITPVIVTNGDLSPGTSPICHPALSHAQQLSRAAWLTPSHLPADPWRSEA